VRTNRGGCDGACGAAQDDGIGGGGSKGRIDEHKGCRDYFLLFDFFGCYFLSLFAFALVRTRDGE